jgi:probable HAF family extracellular repeat protein
VGVSPHAVLWNNGSPVALGSLGGTMLGTAAGINDQGQVVGCTDLATELPGFPGVQCHGFLWTQATGMQDLGTVETDFSSLPDQINNHGDLVGTSCDDQGNCRAFLRPAQGKAMLDLNALIPADSPLYLFWAFGINDSGEIAGMAIETSTGDLHAFLATPSKTAAATGTLPADALRVTTPMALPESTRKLLRRRMGMAGW